ncbi:hypothetical protein LPJ57_002328 [Coemansia sp. RSA 486]|nr:hypothetical protein LPJ57_002328 [Coemansia sp. RSA 486]
MATGNVYTVRQLNNKHINMRSRIATPLISLHDSGYFYKIPLKIPPKSSVKDVIKLSLASTNIEFMSNLDAKFFNLIKTMYKFNAHKHLFWNSQTNTQVDYSEIEKKPLVESDFTESDRWVHAMIATHGQKMVRYMEVCLLNLLNTYITINIGSQKLECEADKFINLYDQEKRHRIFNVIIDELVEMGMQRPAPLNTVFSPENKMELLIGKKRVLEYIDSPDETRKKAALDYLFDDSLLNNDRLLLEPVVNQKTEKNSASSSDSSNISISSSSDFTLDMFMNSVLDIDSLNNMPSTDASNTISSLVPMKQSSSEISSSNSELNNLAVPAVSYKNNFLKMELGGQQPLGTQNSISVGSVTSTWDGYPVCLARPDDDGSAWLNSLFAEQSKSSSANGITNSYNFV